MSSLVFYTLLTGMLEYFNVTKCHYAHPTQ